MYSLWVVLHTLFTLLHPLVDRSRWATKLQISLQASLRCEPYTNVLNPVGKHNHNTRNLSFFQESIDKYHSSFKCYITILYIRWTSFPSIICCFFAYETKVVNSKGKLVISDVIINIFIEEPFAYPNVFCFVFC